MAFDFRFEGDVFQVFELRDDGSEFLVEEFSKEEDAKLLVSQLQTAYPDNKGSGDAEGT